jgi:sialate O-acetylesterase
MKTILLFIAILILAFNEDINAQNNLGGNKLMLPSVFSDNMVLQQKSEVPFWGKGIPNHQIQIKASWGATSNAYVTKDSLWITKIQTPKAGGPYKVTIQSGDSVIQYLNVLIGEVWLCSGQSNMEMPLEGWPPYAMVNNFAEEINNANYPEIRLFTVERAVSNKPEFNCTGKWIPCDSSSAKGFSATAYFFGRKLYKELKVPIGLIHSSWGGTPIEAWTSAGYLRSVGRYDSTLDKMANSDGEIVRQINWIKSHPVIDVSNKNLKNRWKNLEFDDITCSESNFDDSNWKSMKLPTLWENADIGTFDGVVWFRKKIELPKDWLNKNLILDLGPVDDMDRTYVNGKLVGAIEEEGYWQKERIYNIQKENNNDSILTIAVRVVDIQGGGGIYGDKNKMKIHPADDTTGIAISGNWKYLPVAELLNMKFYVYGTKGEEFYSRPKTSVDITAFEPITLYNAMISPIIPYGIKGAIWYQGEANTDEPNFYATLLPLMIKNWRDNWNENDFPFYLVQIAPFNYGDKINSQELRESQLKSLSVPNTGMAVTLDIGEANNIHPADKQDVGKRLALWALAKNYNKKVVYSGPLYKSMKIDGNKIIISFDFADGGLVLNHIEGADNFLIAGKDHKFMKAHVKIEGKQLIVANPEISNPVAVRYAWSNTAQGTLFNKAGLPASSFRTDDWENGN